MNYINDNRLRAEFFGTLVLVLVGCSSIVLTGLGGAFPLTALPIGLAFGLAFAAMVYTIGPVSGCHINPAVTAALWSAGRISGADAIRYVIAQLIGAFVAALLLVLIVKGKAGGYHVADSGLGATTWGTFGVWPAMIVEFIGTTVFTLVFLALTGSKGPGALAGLIIGITLVILHLAFYSVSGASVNPARSFGPALFVGGKAFGQLWMYLIVPTLGGLFAGWLIKSKKLDV